MKRLFAILNKVSTKPNTLSYRWHSSISVISFFILNLIYIERLFSLLQWSKYLYRVIAQHSRANMASTDEKSQRVNVPSLLVEVYHISLALVMILAAYSRYSGSTIVQWFSIYILIDSSVWLLYYFFFRRFFEENYAIMHSLEYTVLLPFVITSQAACVSIIWGIPLKKTFTLLLAPDPASPILIILLGVLYTAVILGLIISNLPNENVKVKSDHKYHISIIGNGDVVKKRLLPAIFALSEKLKKYISVSISDKPAAYNSIDGNKMIETEYLHLSYLNCENEGHLKGVINSEIIWISTPSYSHYPYIEKYKNKAKLLVVEKPVVIYEQELELIEGLINNDYRSLFCLSYYYLEKALPFVYLQRPLAFYEKYLQLSKSRESTFNSFSQLGPLKSISLQLFEGSDERVWLQNEEFGGQYFETFIHLVVIAFTALEKEDTIIADKLEIMESNNVPGGHILCKGHSEKGVSVRLEMKKYTDKSRYGVLEYENGTITIDFETRALTCKFSQESLASHDFTIKTNDSPNYFIQLDMVERCFSDEISPNDIDGCDIQIKALKWMFKQVKVHKS